MAIIKCVHGDVVLYLANVELEVDGLQVKVEAAVSRTLPVAVLLGKNIPELNLLLGRADIGPAAESCQEEAMVVVTRAQAR